MDFIESCFKDKGLKPDIIVHEHCGEPGAIGAALEARRLYSRGMRTKSIGFEAVEQISYQTHRYENTRCYFCKDKCIRTSIDIQLPDANESWTKSKMSRPSATSKRYREHMLYRKQKQAEIDATPGGSLLPGPPPAVYEVESYLEINANPASSAWH